MGSLTVGGLGVFYEDDWFGAPWRTPEVAVLLHGVAESSRAWGAWVPHLAPEVRTVRPDLPGFGRSEVPAPGYDWSPAGLAVDVARFLDALGVDAAHVVGAKYGGTVALQFAATYPRRTLTLSVVSSPVRGYATGGSVDLSSYPERIRRHGVRGWAAETQRTRLGPDASDEQVAWWTEFMAATDPRVCLEIVEAIAHLDIGLVLERIEAPTLVVTTEGSGLQAVATVRRYQERIPGSKLLVLPGASYHPAAVQADECARHVLKFITTPRSARCRA